MPIYKFIRPNMSTSYNPTSNPARVEIQVVLYNTNWPKDFESIRSELSSYLGDAPYISIEHVGSTSIPNLPAKPIIDVDIVVSLTDVDAVTGALVKNGNYEFRGDRGIPLRYMMKEPSDSKLPKHNLYVCVDGCTSLRNHLAVRQVLTNDEQLRNEYAEVKMGLAKEEGIHIDDYIEGKSAVLQKILKKANFNMEELDGINEANKSVVNRLRDNKYSFSGIIDSSTMNKQ